MSEHIKGVSKFFLSPCGRGSKNLGLRSKPLVFAGEGASFLFLAFLALLAIFPAHAEEETGDKLRQVESQLKERQQEQKVLAATAQKTSKGLDDLRQRMVRATQSLQEKEAEQANLEDKLDELAKEIAEKGKNAKVEREQLSLMVSALVEISSRPPISLFLQNRVTSDHIHRTLLFQSLTPRLKEQAENAARDLMALYDLQAKFAEQKRLVAAARGNLEKQQKDMDQMIAARQGLLQRTEEQREETARHLAALSAEAQDLRQLMAKVSRMSPGKPARLAHALKLPVSGSVRRNFGDKDADGVISEGMTLVAPSGAPIVAPLAGRVAFAGPFRGYGLILILQHAGGYHSFLSGFGRIDADMGQDVVAGEPLGVLPVKAGKRPELYFEWRRGEQTLDPMRVKGLGVRG